MGQRAYCDQPHPIDDAAADRWCADYHQPRLPRTVERARREQSDKLDSVQLDELDVLLLAELDGCDS